MPGSAFHISRTAHCNNTSNYYINDRRSNFGEVTDLLKAKGIDLDNNRFLILQVLQKLIFLDSPSTAPAAAPHGRLTAARVSC